ncbi:MAG: hypothetical protein IPQ18_14720 [Saprospiraceae bacterium]|nr:hypothetical protein [Saprospiraceae bacterium]
MVKTKNLNIGVIPTLKFLDPIYDQKKARHAPAMPPCTFMVIQQEGRILH